MFVVFVGAIYFLMIRPQQKCMREYQSQIDALLPGARAILNSGIFITISHIADTQTITELTSGAKITILKQTTARVTKNDGKELEFTDETEETPEDEESEESAGGVDAPKSEDTSVAGGPVSEKN